MTGSLSVMQYNTELDVFARNTNDNKIYKNTWQPANNAWSGWGMLGGNETSDPTALKYNTELDVFATNSSSNTDKNTWNGSVWSGFFGLL